MERIAICQYQWPLQAQEINLIHKLINSGFEVDVFLFDCWEGKYISLGQFAGDNNIKIYNFEALNKDKNSFFKKVNFYLNRRFRFKDVGKTVIKKEILNRSRKIFDKYKYVIGIDKKGLIWAGKLLKRSKDTSLIYYSLELYLEKDIYCNAIPAFYKLRRLERKYHRSCSATIIQDKSRAEVLFQYNKVKTDLIYLPVSVRGSKQQCKNSYFHRKFNLPKEYKIILYLGLLTKRRYCFDLREVSEKLDSDKVIILHGAGPIEEVEKLRELETKNFLISTDLLPEERISELITSCDIGLALYSNVNYNDRLTAFSSEKLALYTQSGKPFIAFNNESYRYLRNDICCCELINTIDNLPKAIGKIINHYSSYKDAAHKAFEKYYSFDKTGDLLIDYFKHN